MSSFLSLDRSSAKSQPPKSPVTESHNLLSFDGGGVRGISSMIILKRIMDKVQEIENRAKVENGVPIDEAERRPVDYFDLGAGTSTGGLIALMLFRLEMRCSDVIESYQELARLVFQPKLGVISLHKLGRIGVFVGNRWLNIKALTGRSRYSHVPLEKAIDAVVERFPLDADDKVRKGDAVLVKESKGKMFMCATLADKGESILLRNYNPAFAPLPVSNGASNLDFASITIKEAARATSAAPTYLKEVHIQGLNFWDGGLLNNNPIYQVWDNRLDLVGRDDRSPHITCVLSLGTTHPEYKTTRASPAAARFLNVVSKTVSFATNTEAKHRDFERNMRQINRRRIDRKKSKTGTGYHRFNAPTAEKSYGLADYLSMPKLVEFTNRYLEDPKIEAQIEDCARILAKTT